MNKALEAPNDSLSAVSNTPPRHDSFNEKHELIYTVSRLGSRNSQDWLVGIRREYSVHVIIPNSNNNSSVNLESSKCDGASIDSKSGVRPTNG